MRVLVSVYRSVVILFTFLILAACTTEASGRLYVTGSAPDTYLVFQMQDGSLFRVRGPLHDTLWDEYQGQTLRLLFEIIELPKGPVPGTIEVLEIKG